MGNGAFKSCEIEFVARNDVPGQSHRVMRIASKLGLNKERVDKLFREFCKIPEEPNRLGLITMEAYFVENDVNEPWIRHMLSKEMWKNEAKDHLDFEEYLIAVWDFCSADLLYLVNEIFLYFDSSRTGFMSSWDLEQMVSSVWGATHLQYVRDVIAELHHKSNDSMTVYDLLAIAEDTPSSLLTIKDMQTHVRVQTFGMNGVFDWSELAAYRRKQLRDAAPREILGELFGYKPISKRDKYESLLNVPTEKVTIPDSHLHPYAYGELSHSHRNSHTSMLQRTREIESRLKNRSHVHPKDT